MVNFDSNSSKNIKNSKRILRKGSIFHGGNMQSQADNTLLTKITELEDYLNNRYPEKRHKIHEFLDDLKAIEPNLSILGLLNHLAEMYKDGSSTLDIVKDVNKTKKIFTLAGEYVKSLESDKTIGLLSKEIHEIILNHLEKALQLYKDEYDIVR